MNDVFVAKKGDFEMAIIVDDVFTTGATMSDAARALKQAGKKMVFGVTLAR